jgi:hypothetical protein
MTEGPASAASWMDNGRRYQTKLCPTGRVLWEEASVFAHKQLRAHGCSTHFGSESSSCEMSMKRQASGNAGLAGCRDDTDEVAIVRRR